MMTENRCISCGEIIPEGRAVCPSCETRSNRGVHQSHCCKWHGCKYGDDNCPVVHGLVKQDYLCEWCNEDLENEEYLLQTLKNIQEMKELKHEQSNSSYRHAGVL